MVSCAPSDEALMALIRERDANAFDELAARYAKTIGRRLRGIVRDEDAASDLVQEVLLRLWTHADQWDGRGPLKTWLFRIATNLALNHLRSVRRRRERPFEITPDPDDENEENSAPGWMIDASALCPEEAAVLAERQRLIRSLVDQLPEEKREVLRLIHEADMDIREVSEALGVPEGTVKSRLHYAKKRLAHEWKNVESELEEM